MCRVPADTDVAAPGLVIAESVGADRDVTRTGVIGRGRARADATLVALKRRVSNRNVVVSVDVVAHCVGADSGVLPAACVDAASGATEERVQVSACAARSGLSVARVACCACLLAEESVLVALPCSDRSGGVENSLCLGGHHAAHTCGRVGDRVYGTNHVSL